MKDETAADRAKLTGLVVAHGLAGAARAVRRPFVALASRRSRVPTRLLIAPQDIRTADPTVAADIYSGYFAFDGKTVTTRGLSPFAVTPPSDAWAEALAGFGWLRHLRAADTALARVNARALVADWIDAGARPAPAGVRRPGVVARRLLSWVSQSPLILDGADGAFYRRFMRSLVRQADGLVAALGRAPDDPARLLALVSLCELALCSDGLDRLQRRASRLLGAELDRQILPDGGHVGRNPGTLVDLLLDLLPLRQAYTIRGVPPPPALPDAIDRMMPMVRRFRHRDGAMALFNGMGVTFPDVLATVLSYDDAQRAPPRDAAGSNYRRLDAADATLIVDAGPPPPVAFAAEAHAGTLAFEFASGAQRIVVNCGAASAAQPAARIASRATAAHSTLVLGERSSSRFASGGPLRGVLYAGPRVVRDDRAQGPDGIRLDLVHDGYARRFGYLHARCLWLAADGARLVGEDRIVPAEGRRRRPGRVAFAIRFHLHPSLRAALSDGGGAQIDGPGGLRWLFEAGGLPVAVEESIFFASAEGPRRADQIVVHGAAPDVTGARWSLSRATTAPEDG